MFEGQSGVWWMGFWALRRVGFRVLVFEIGVWLE